MKIYTIYRIENLINGNDYIGMHITEDLNDGYFGSGIALKRAIKKYGRENFKYSTIYYALDSEKLKLAEKFFIWKYASWVGFKQGGYNVSLNGGQGGDLGLPEHIKRQKSEKLKGRVISEETRKKISDKAKGRKWTEEQKEKLKSRMFLAATRGKLSARGRGRACPEHVKEFLRSIRGDKHKNYGKTHSFETRKKLSIISKNTKGKRVCKKWTDEQKEYIRNINLGRKQDPQVSIHQRIAKTVAVSYLIKAENVNGNNFVFMSSRDAAKVLTAKRQSIDKILGVDTFYTGRAPNLEGWKFLKIDNPFHIPNKEDRPKFKKEDIFNDDLEKIEKLKSDILNYITFYKKEI